MLLQHRSLQTTIKSPMQAAPLIQGAPRLLSIPSEFSKTIILAKTSNTRRTPSIDSWVSVVDNVWSRSTGTHMVLAAPRQVAWAFDSPWITGPMTPYQSHPYARHIALMPAAKLCDSIAIIFLSIKVTIWHHLCWYLDRQRHFVYCQSIPIWPDNQRFRHAARHDENYVE